MLHQNKTPFGQSRRKIAPFDLPSPPPEGADYQTLAGYSRDKAAALNKHVVGFGSLAESEWEKQQLETPDLFAMRAYRLRRIREQLRQQDCSAAILCDPLNVRYATDCTNMQVWCTHNAVRYCFVALEGPVILFDFHNCEHLSAHSEQVDEIRHGIPWFYFEAGERYGEHATAWARELSDLVREHGGSNRRIAIDRVNPEGAWALTDLGMTLCNGEKVMELARSVKSPDEICAMRRAITSCEAAMGEMEAVMRPGMSETDLWALLHSENIRRGGEWIETHLLASGPRTNPWFQEASARIIQAGDLVAFDTDLVGPYGMCCDISRTWLCGDGRPTNEQRTLYQMALDQIQSNMALLQPGRTFTELSQSATSLPADYIANRYSVLFHGVGLCDEYPCIRYPEDLDSFGYSGVLEPGMVLCVESYVGRHGGHEGVKLEDQVLITDTGHECLSRYPYDRRLGN